MNIFVFCSSHEVSFIKQFFMEKSFAFQNFRFFVSGGDCNPMKGKCQ